MRLTWLLLLVGLLSAARPGFAAAPETETNFFPLMAWNWVPKDPAVLQRMHQAGLTIAGFVAPDALDACQAAGLKAIVSDERTSGYDWAHVDEGRAATNVASLVAQVGRHPALFGYYLRDEPDAGSFAGLAKVAGLVRQLSPGKWPYINLFPDYASAGQLGAANYTEYLERFVATCHPTLLSYDNYSLMDDGSVRESYWTNLEAVRAVCRKHGVEFWNIVLAVAHFNYRELNAADFRFQVYTTLAYGGRGISYFTYFAPQLGNYRQAPVDQFGHETANWYYLQNINFQVQKLAPTLLQLTSDNVYHFGKLPAGTCAAPTNSLITAISGDDAVVGDFTHRDGSRFVLIVNKDLAKSRPCQPQFRRTPRRIQHVSPFTGTLKGFDGEDIWLAPGQGTLLKVEF